MIMVVAQRRLTGHAGEIRALRPWMAALARNVCLDLIRKRLRERRAIESLAVDRAKARSSDVPTVRVGDTELEALSPCLREAFVLRFQQGMTHREIAAVLGTTESAARKRVQRAREQLRSEETGFRKSVRSAKKEQSPKPTYSHVFYASHDRLVIDEFVPIVGLPIRRYERLKTLDAYVAGHPRGWRRRLERARLLFSLGALEEAACDYSFIASKKAIGLEVVREIATLFAMLGRADEVRQVVNRYAKRAARSDAKPHLGGLLAECSGKTHEAVEHYQLARARAPNEIAHPRALANVMHRYGELVGAREAAEQVLQAVPDDLVAAVRNCRVLVELGHEVQSANLVDRFLERHRRCAPLLLLLGRRRCRARLVRGVDGTETRRICRALVKRYPESADAHAALADYHLSRGDGQEAEAVLSSLVQRQRLNGLAWQRLAECRLASSRVREAADAMKVAIGLGGDIARSRSAVRIFAAAGLRQEVQDLVADLAEGGPRDWRVWVAVAEALLDANLDPAAALSASERATRLAPQIAQAWLCRARASVCHREYRDAVESIQTARALLPATDAHQLAVRCLVLEAECQSAQSEAPSQDLPGHRRFDALRFEAPHLAELWAARAFEAVGDREAATAAYRRSLKLHLPFPQSAWVEVRLEGLLR